MANNNSSISLLENVVTSNASKFSIQTVFIVIGIILVAALCAIIVEKYWKKSLRSIFTRKKNKHASTWYRLKRWVLLAFLITVNILGIVLAYFFGNQRAIMAVLIISKAKDILCTLVLPIYYICKTLICYDAKRPILDGRNQMIVSIIPVYNETLEEIAYTMDSIIYNSIKLYQMLVVIICDGNVPNVDFLIDRMNATLTDLEYRSWKGPDVKSEATFGYRGKTPLVIIKKGKNMEKRDSLILAYDIFNEPRHNAASSLHSFRTSILQQIKLSFKIDEYHYLFFTDADSFIELGSLTSLIDDLEYRNASAACGLVMVDFEKRFGGFWNIYQNFQYLYGQFVRRKTENIIGKVTCLPGCITMVKVDSRLVNVVSDYGTIAHHDNLIHTTIQRLGTDRRLTHLFLYYKLKTVMVDSAICYTKPPQSWYRLLTQRRRWGSNAFFNTSMNAWRSNIHPIIRISSMLDLMRMSLVFFRFFNLGLFISQLISTFDLNNFLMQLGILIYPPCYFFVFSIFKKTIRPHFHKILIGFIINRFISGIISVGVMATVFYNIGNFAWGPSASTQEIKERTPDVYIVPNNQVTNENLPAALYDPNKELMLIT